MMMLLTMKRLDKQKKQEADKWEAGIEVVEPKEKHKQDGYGSRLWDMEAD